MPQERYSRQREAVLNTVMASTIHPTAEIVYERVREEIPTISLGTVYRNLNHLVKKGRILEVLLDDNVTRYDGNVEEHYHCICTECGEILDVHLDADTVIAGLASRIDSFQVTSHKFELYGVCEECRH